MTEEQALAFMAVPIVICEDEDGTLFGVCEHDDGSGHCLILAPDRRATHLLADDAGAEVVTVAELAEAAGWSAP